MAIDTFAPEYFNQSFAPPEMFRYPRIMFATDLSSWVPPGGNQVTWPDVEGSITTATYSRGTNLTDLQGYDQEYTLTVDQFKAVSIPVDDVDRIQRMPELMAQYIMQADRELMWDINTNIRNEFRKSARLAASGLTQPERGSRNGLTSNVHNIPFIRVGGSAATGKPVWKTADARDLLMSAIDNEAGAFAKRHGWATSNANTKGIVIMPIEVASEIRRYLVNDKPQMGSGIYQDSAFGLGQVMNVYGWEVIEDETEPELPGDGAARAAGWARLDFIHPERLGVAYARQLVSVETERIQRQFGTRLKMLYMHGATQAAARHLYEITLELD